MNIKFMIYFIFIVSLSLLTGFFEYFTVISFSEVLFFGIILFASFHLFFYLFYNFFLKINNHFIVSKGLFFSSVFGGALMIIFIFIISGFEGGVNEWNILIGKIYFFTFFTYLASALICFIIDSFFNKETKGIKKWKIGVGSFLFYSLNYAISYFVALIVSFIGMIVTWS